MHRLLYLAPNISIFGSYVSAHSPALLPMVSGMKREGSAVLERKLPSNWLSCILGVVIRACTEGNEANSHMTIT